MTDRFTVRAVVLGLIAIALVGIIAAAVLVSQSMSVPDGIWTIAASAAGALGTLLARTSSDNPPAP